MAEIFELDAQVRTDIGKGASRRLRRTADLVPAIIYGTGKEPTPITLDHKVVIRAVQNEAFYSHILKLNVDGKVQQVVLKDMQRHAYKPKVLHMDFLRIKADEKLTMNVPLHFLNEETAPGAKQGGVITHLMTEVEITCLPKDLPEFIEADMGAIDMDQSLHLSAITLPAGVELKVAIDEEHDPAIASIHMPRAVKEEDDTVAEATDGDSAEAKPDDAADDSASNDGDKS